MTLGKVLLLFEGVGVYLREVLNRTKASINQEQT